MAGPVSQGFGATLSSSRTEDSLWEAAEAQTLVVWHHVGPAWVRYLSFLSLHLQIGDPSCARSWQGREGTLQGFLSLSGCGARRTLEGDCSSCPAAPASIPRPHVHGSGADSSDRAEMPYPPRPAHWIPQPRLMPPATATFFLLLCLLLKKSLHLFICLFLLDMPLWPRPNSASFWLVQTLSGGWLVPLICELMFNQVKHYFVIIFLHCHCCP